MFQFLEVYYGKSYETLLNRVRNGETLTDHERERFMCEKTHQYYQLLFNTAQLQVDSALLDALGRKLSVNINDTAQILL